MMKVALVHDYIKEYGGAERVLETLHEMWPDAPIFTSVYLPEFLGPHRERFADWKIITSPFQRIPFSSKIISPLRWWSGQIFENFDFRGFDAVIVSATGAYFPNLILRQPETIHICYCHTPPRYLYGYPTARNWKKNAMMRLIGETMNHNLRQVDFLAAQRPDYYIANSLETKNRIRKFYRRDAEVIYPPIEINSKLKTQNSKLKRNDYYLAGGRLARAKHIDLAIRACNELKVPLKVFGKPFADYGEELMSIAGPTIEFLGEVSEERLSALYSGAKALIYPSEYEDFGIIPVEAQSHGVPVVGLNQGGVKETVIEGKTGVLFAELTTDSVISAIKRLGKLNIRSTDCVYQAKKFSKVRFRREIVSYIGKIFADKKKDMEI